MRKKTKNPWIFGSSTRMTKNNGDELPLISYLHFTKTLAKESIDYWDIDGRYTVDLKL